VPATSKRSGSRAARQPASRAKTIARWTILALALLLAGGGIWLYRALSYAPPFYTAALEMPQAELEQSNREMLRRFATLTGDVKRVGRWQALFTEAQINGWLAVDLPKNHPEVLPPTLRNPRVQIVPGGIHLAAEYHGTISAVVSLEIDATLQQADVLAVRIRKVKVGDVPWALDRLVDEAVLAAREWGFEVRQTQSDGDPVLLLSLPPDIQQKRQVSLESMELRENEIYLAGETAAAQRP
jgi:hypothetical protein